MSANIDREREIETYKSLIQISLEGSRLLAILNGGTAVALVSYLGNISAKRGAVWICACRWGATSQGYFSVVSVSFSAIKRNLYCSMSGSGGNPPIST